MLRIAPHLVEPLAFVLPHEPHLRPAWMIRIGLFLYDHLGGRRRCRSRTASTCRHASGRAGLKHRFRKGFVYADARVDDARLVVVNALDAKAHGADIRVRTKLVGARRDGGAVARDARSRDGATTRGRGARARQHRRARG